MMAAAQTGTSPARSPARSVAPAFSSPLPAEAPKESAVSRLLIAPMTLISFLVSLALIDSRNHRARFRTHENSSPHPAPQGLYQNMKYYLHTIIWKSVPVSPYAYVKSPEKEVIGDRGEKKGSDEPWYWRTKQRHMMKAEMDEAFRVRKWVVVFLVLSGVVWVLAMGMLWKWIGYLLGF